MPKPAPKLNRTTFITSRELEYFSSKELSRELGSSSIKWPLVLTKELIDNALDACETSEIAPEITVRLDGTRVSVADNGPGLPKKTLKASLDYNSRTSDKAHYVSPTRGQIGNALKCLWAGPFVYNGEYGNDERGSVTVTTPLYSCEISVSVDKIKQKPKLTPVWLDRELVKSGTLIEIEWKTVAGYIPVEIADFYKSDEEEDENDEEIEDEETPEPRTFSDEVQFLLESYATFNPHASFLLCRHGQTVAIGEALLPGWNKWRTDYPTSPHWYDAEDLRTLIAGYVSNAKGTMTVREFVTEFRGITGSTKPKVVLAAANLSGQCLNDLISNDEIDMDKTESLLKAMQEASRPVKAAMMGLIGEETLSRRLSEIDGAVSEGIQYVKVPSEDARPTLIEVVFGVRRDDNGRRIRFGLNCSPAFECPVQGLESFLQYGLSIDPDAPISMAVHIMRPALEFTSRAKSMLT